MTEPCDQRRTPKSDTEEMFTFYQKLPSELQKRVWKLSAQHFEPRLISFRRKSGSIPAILHACQLSRSVIKEIYHLLTYRQDDECNSYTVPINFDIDVILLPKCLPFGEHYHEYTDWFRPAKRVALPRSWQYDPKSIQYIGQNDIEKFLSKFPRLEVLMFIGGCPPFQRKVPQYRKLIEIKARLVLLNNQSQDTSHQHQLKLKVMKIKISGRGQRKNINQSF
jgi:2EXR family